LVDDHPVVTHGIKSILESSSDVRVLATFATARELMQYLAAAPERVDVAVMDFALGPDDVDGLNLLRALRAKFAALPVMVLSAHHNPATVSLAMQAGARGFFSKSDPMETLASAIKTVASGGTYLSDGMREQLAELTAAPLTAKTDLSTIREELTAREHEVIRCTLEGMTTSQISAKFKRAMSTISTQKKAAFQKLGIRSDSELFKLRHLFE
jgi:DNA-binding NarL/FixJ family response regulator